MWNLQRLRFLLECPRKYGVYWGYNPLILTFDPNFQRDIQVLSRKKKTSITNPVKSWSWLVALPETNSKRP